MLMLNRTLTLLRGRSRTFPRRTLEVKCLEINVSWVHPLTPGRPLGALARTARVVTQAFERAMAEAGGSPGPGRCCCSPAPSNGARRRGIAEAMGIRGV